MEAGGGCRHEHLHRDHSVLCSSNMHDLFMYLLLHILFCFMYFFFFWFRRKCSFCPASGEHEAPFLFFFFIKPRLKISGARFLLCRRSIPHPQGAVYLFLIHTGGCILLTEVSPFTLLNQESSGPPAQPLFTACQHVLTHTHTHTHTLL